MLSAESPDQARTTVWKQPNHQVKKVAERKFPEFFTFSSRILPRILLRIFPKFFEEFSCFVSWQTETKSKFHQDSPPFFNAKFPCKLEENTHKSFLESRRADSQQVQYKSTQDFSAALRRADAAQVGAAQHHLQKGI